MDLTLPKPVVNFINILRALFSYKSLVTFWQKKVLSCEKRARKLLMKLTPAVEHKESTIQFRIIINPSWSGFLACGPNLNVIIQCGSQLFEIYEKKKRSFFKA